MASQGTDVDTSNIDFYEFLSLPGPQASASEIKRAGRKTSLLYHPDKVAPTPENLQKFHVLQIVINTLTDPAEKAKYDQTRESRLRRKAEIEALDARRRKMREDLEDREGGLSVGTTGPTGQKRTFSEREMKIRRIQEENRRKIEEMKARKRFEAEQSAARERAQATKDEETKDQDLDAKPEEQAAAGGDDRMSRSIKLKWIREGTGQAYDEGSISDMFSPDDVENVILLKDKKRRIDGKKVMMGTAVVVLTSFAAATKAMEKKGSFIDFESIEWAGKKDEEPS